MKKITFTCFIVLLLFVAGKINAQSLASRVLVVKNTKSPVSIAIANDYMKRRNVTNVINVTCPDDAHDQGAESINYPDYLNAIEAPIAAYLKLHKNIDFIVFTKGIPIRVYNTPGMPYGGVCSLDSRISILGYKDSPASSIIHVTDPNYGSDYVGNAWANKYWNSGKRFTHKEFGGYLVTRLDGYTQADAIALTTRSLEAEKNRKSGNTKRGPILLDACGDFGFTDKNEQPYTLIPANYTPGDTIFITHESNYAEYNSDMTVANDYLLSQKIPVLYDTAPEFVGGKTNLQGYISWGSNDSHYDAAGYNALRFSPGAIAETAVSTSARTFLPTEGGQSLIDDLVKQGVTGVKGYTDEPLLQGIASPSVMFNRYTRGWTLAESFYAASRLVGWMGMIIGDPICQAYPGPNQAPVLKGSGGAAIFKGASAIAVDNAITVSDDDNTTLASAMVSVTAAFHSGDVLAFVSSGATGNITGSYNSTTGVLTLTSASAGATVAQWQAALRSVTYQSTLATPNTATRTISFVVNDGDKGSTPVTKNITIAVPVISTTGKLSALTTIYGTASPSGTFNVSGISMGAGILVSAPAGFEVSTDNIAFSNTVTVGSSGTITSTPVHIRLAAGINAGNYSGNVVLSSTGAASVNVATLTSSVNKAVLTITANDKVKAFGQALTGGAGSTEFTSTGLVNSETVGTVTITYGAGAAANAAVNTYTGSVAASAATGGTFAPGNYNINYIAGDIIIGKKVLTITADNATKIYGSANPALSMSYSGFTGTDDASSLTTAPTVSTTALTNSPVSTYPVTASGAVSANYTIVYKTGVLTVNRAALTITADNKTRIYGVVNPSLTATYSGFVNGDTPASLTVAPTLNTVANITSAPGVYDITAGGAVSSNYLFNYMGGRLTVTPLSIASLSSLGISSGTLSPAFDMVTPAYAAQVANDVDNVRVTPAFHATATAKVNGTQTSNGSPSSNIRLNVGNNTITIVITAQDGVTSATYTINVYRGESQENIAATNILSPNGDGKNDTWIVKDIELFPNNMVTVFDRGGRTVYTKHGYSNDWRGTYGGAPLTEGTYYYVVDLGPKLRRIKGFITILRNR